MLRFDVRKVIINFALTKEEALASEATLINTLNYVGEKRLSNIVAGHHSKEALSVEDFN